MNEQRRQQCWQRIEARRRKDKIAKQMSEEAKQIAEEVAKRLLTPPSPRETSFLEILETQSAAYARLRDYQYRLSERELKNK